jgi:hypothetical protein
MPNWNEVLGQIQAASATHAQLSKAAVDLVQALYQHTKRNVRMEVNLRVRRVQADAPARACLSPPCPDGAILP